MEHKIMVQLKLWNKKGELPFSIVTIFSLENNSVLPLIKYADNDFWIYVPPPDKQYRWCNVCFDV